MAKLVFMGGDVNDPENHRLFCTCEAPMGRLGAFRPNAEGWRSVGCPICKRKIFIDKSGQLKVIDPTVSL